MSKAETLRQLHLAPPLLVLPNAWDVASADALHGTIYIANFQTTGEPGYHGSVSVCTLAQGCGRRLRSSLVRGRFLGIAVDGSNNVYVSGQTGFRGHKQSGMIALFRNGQEPAVAVPGYTSAFPAGLDFDKAGNLVAFDSGWRSISVLTGCPDNCIVHGRFALQSLTAAYFAKITPDGKQLQVGNVNSSTVDVYAYYGVRGIKYLYSYVGQGAVVGSLAMTAQ